MSGVGFFELVILFMIGLVVLGPQRLPKVANQLGAWIGQARRMTRVMKRQLEEELELDRRPKARKPAFSPPPVIGTSVPDEEKAPEAAQVEDHIPNDDDSYSPAHDDGEQEKPG